MIQKILDPGFNLTLRPMRYPKFFELYKQSIKGTWNVNEVDFSTDINDLYKMPAAERHLIHRLVAFFATGDSIVSNNLVLNLYKHINASEARMFLSRQLFEEAQHVEAYLLLLDTYIADPNERNRAFAAIDNIPSICAKADFCFKWIDSIRNLDRISTYDEQRQFLRNLIGFAACIEGLFFFGAFAYVYFLRSRGKLNGLATMTDWIFNDESRHINFAFEVIDTVRQEEPHLFDKQLETDIHKMFDEAIDAEAKFSEDVLSGGVTGLSPHDIHTYLQYVADQRLTRLGYSKRYHVKNPLSFMELQDVTALENFFERRVTSYQTGIEGEVDLKADF